MKTLYFDCFAGASGDMILGALVSLGVDKDRLVAELSKLNISDFKIETSIVDRSGISAVKVNVIVPEENKHRHLHHIEEIINSSSLSNSVKTRAIQIFTRLAEAEASVHGIEIDKVHFHEVGAMDAIIDVVGACIGFEMLSIEKFVCSKIHVGSGFVNMAHGKFPVPPPAVAELLSNKNIPIYSTEIEGELITPTGAAIISTLCDESGAIPEMEITQTGYGAGGREYKDFPNVLRLMLGESKEENIGLTKHKLTLIETNIDDLSPEILGYVMERAIALGALDCWFTPIQMKKNRPATMLSILCDAEDKQKLMELVFKETSSIGVRVTETDRYCLEREKEKVKTEYGEIEVKIAKLDGKVVNVKFEFEQLKEKALESGEPLRKIQEEVKKKFGLS